MYDGGELPTFFTRDRKHYVYYNDVDKDDKSKEFE